MNAQAKASSSPPVKSTSRMSRRHKLVFVVAVMFLCVALVASVSLLTMIVVRRRQQQQQQPDDVIDDDDDATAPSRGHVPRRRNWTSSLDSSTLKEVDASDLQHRRSTDVRAKDNRVPSTLSSRLAVFHALQTASWSTNQPPSTSSRGDRHRRRQKSRRRRPSGRRHRGRQQHRDNGDVVVGRSADLRRLARIALNRRNSND